MEITKVLVYVCAIACFTIYIHFEKRRSYQKGFTDGVEHFSYIVEKVLHQTNRFNKEAEEAGMPFTSHVESIKPLNKNEEDENE